MYPYFYILENKIPAYGVMLLAGYFAGIIVILIRSKLYPIPKSDAFVAYIFAGLGALFGGKLFYILQGWPQFLRLKAEQGLTLIDYVYKSGLVFYGGFFGCVLFTGLYCIIFKFRFWNVLDILTPALPLAQAFGRLGCFFVGCCYGIPYEYGIIMSASPFIATDTPLLPVQLIESGCVLVLFISIMIYGKKKRSPGKILGFYMIGYGIIRFILEFFRGDKIRGFYGALSISQWISVFVILTGFFLYFSFNGHSAKFEGKPADF